MVKSSRTIIFLMKGGGFGLRRLSRFGLQVVAIGVPPSFRPPKAASEKQVVADPPECAYTAPQRWTCERPPRAGRLRN